MNIAKLCKNKLALFLLFLVILCVVMLLMYYTKKEEERKKEGTKEICTRCFLPGFVAATFFVSILYFLNFSNKKEVLLEEDFWD